MYWPGEYSLHIPISRKPNNRTKCSRGQPTLNNMNELTVKKFTLEQPYDLNMVPG